MDGRRRSISLGSGTLRPRRRGWREPTEDHFLPDCDLDAVPVPPGGALEGEEGYECRGDGDCHRIVVDRSRRKLFEMWRAMAHAYPASGRGEQCTSADAAGSDRASSSAQTRSRLDHRSCDPVHPPERADP
jgi:hypothetical protein